MSEIPTGAQAPEQQVEQPEKDYTADVEAFIKANGHLLTTIAGDSSIHFEAGDGFAFFPKEGKITLDKKDWKWAEEMGLEQGQILWSSLHEIAHLQDMAQDPKEFLALFDRLKNTAKKLAPKVVAAWGQGDIASAENFLYGVYHRLYNCLDDIYVNRLIGDRSSQFSEGGSKAQKVEDLYRDFLFPTHKENIGQAPQEGEAVDYKDLPLNYQFCYYLLRKHMVPDQEIEVSPEVKEALKIIKEVSTITRPTGRFDTIKHNAGWRYEQIRKKIEPIFTELLMKDINKLPPPQEKSAGSGESGNSWKPIDKPGPITEDDVKNFIEDKKEKKKEDNPQTAKDKASNAKKNEEVKFCKDHDIDPATAKEYDQIESSIEQYKDKLAEVFERIMQTVSEQIDMAFEGYYRSGRLDVREFIEKYGGNLDEDAPDLPEEVLVYLRQEFTKKLKLFPDKTRLRLVLDGSGSMDYTKILAVKETMILVLESLATFEKTFNMRFELEKPFRVDTEVRVFGDRSKIIKPFSENSSYDPDEDRAERIRSLQFVNNNYGLTYDNEVWSNIDESLSDEQYIQSLKKGQAREIIFEVTDGGSSNEHATKDQIGKVIKKGVITRGLQIGQPSIDEQRIFDRIWQAKGKRIKNPQDLILAVANMLEEELSSNPFTIDFQED